MLLVELFHPNLMAMIKFGDEAFSDVKHVSWTSTRIIGIVKREVGTPALEGVSVFENFSMFPSGFYASLAFAL